MYLLLRALPNELKVYHIMPFIDEISLMCLRNVLLATPFPEELTKEQHDTLFAHQLSFIQYFYDHDMLRTEYFWRSAGFNGNLSAIKWSHSLGIQYDFFASANAAQHGHDDVLEWLHQNNLLKDNYFLIEYGAGRGGHLNVFKWIIKQGIALTASMYEGAAEGNHWHIIQWLEEMQCPYDSRVCSGAAHGGNLDLLKSLIEKRYPYDVTMIINAVQSGNLKLVKYCTDIGLEPFDKLCDIAAATGYLHILKYVSQFCVPDAHTYAAACGGGHLYILQWLKKKGCPRNSQAGANAAERGDLKTLEWLKADGYHFDEMSFILGAKHLKILQWLYNIGCPYNQEVFAEAASYGNLTTLKWLKNIGCPWDVHSFSNAAWTTDIEVLEWLKENECPFSLSSLYESIGFEDVPFEETEIEKLLKDNYYASIWTWFRENGYF